MMAGMGDVCGLREKNNDNWFLESASADAFLTPGR
jgi:hypothetical protein